MQTRIHHFLLMIFFSLPILTYSHSLSHSLHPETNIISYSQLRSTYSHLDHNSFETKLVESLSRPLLFFRSFVNTYYYDSSQILPPTRIIYCLGDPHPENFGFKIFSQQNTKQETRYVFNDLDDSGPCPLELDILRYFVALHLSEDDDKLLKNMIRHYFKVYQNNAYKKELGSHLYPNLEDRRNRILRRFTNGKKFQANTRYQKVNKSLKASIIKQVKVQIPNLKVLDVVYLPRLSGGSAGLDRYWLLVQVDGDKDIYEIKEVSPAGTSYGTWKNKSLSFYEQLEMSKKYIWQDSPNPYHIINVNNKDFLLRSRARDDIDLTKLSKKERKEVYYVQVSILAEYHSSFKFEIENLEEWIYKKTIYFSQRYSNTYKFFKSKYKQP